MPETPSRFCNPWLTAVNWNHRSTVCSLCWKPSRHLRACTKCRYCYYCDAKCQKLHWEEEHRRECSLLERLILALEWKSTEISFCSTAEILFFKALTRFTNLSSSEQTTFQERSVLDLFSARHDIHRWDRVMMPGLCDGLVDHHDKLLTLIKKVAPASAIGRETRWNIAKNVLLTSGDIKTEYFGGGFAPGTGLHFAPAFLRTVCRGNCVWLVCGRKYVSKALVDIPDFRSLDQLSVSAPVFEVELLTRMEKYRVIFAQKFIPTTFVHEDYVPRSSLPKPGSIERNDFWLCHCVHCSDEREAGLNPIKCITASCMEPILCDSRALQPCSQCEADNGSGLAFAQEGYHEFNNILGDVRKYGTVGRYRTVGPTKYGAKYGTKYGTVGPTVEKQIDLEVAFKLEKDLQASEVVHPDCMILNKLYVEKHVQPAWEYRKKSVPFIKNYHGPYSTVDFHYADFLATTFWMALAAKSSPGSCRRSCKKSCCRERNFYKKMGFEGRKTLVNLSNVEWSDKQAKKILANFQNLLDVYNDSGFVAHHKPGFWS